MAFAADAVKPEAARIDETGQFPAALVRQAASAGYLGLLVPRDFGGLGVDHVSYALAIEAIARASATLAVILAVHNSLVGETIAAAGSQAQKERWLRDLASGKTLGAFALSEADAGTDAANQQTTAVRASSGYRLDGRKVWVANGEHAGVALVFAATDPGARGRGVSAFLIPLDRAGIRREPGVDSLGVRGLGCVDLVLSGVEVAEDERVGAENGGFAIARQALEAGRIAIAAQALGVGQAALDEAIAHAKTRQTFGRPIARVSGDPVVRGRHGDGAGGRAHADAQGCSSGRPAAAVWARSGNGQTGGVGSRAPRGRQGDADPGLGRLPARINRRAPVPRRPGHRDLPGHLRSAANDYFVSCLGTGTSDECRIVRMMNNRNNE